MKEVLLCHCALCRRLYTALYRLQREGAKLPLSYSSVLTCQTDVSQTVITFVTNTTHQSPLTRTQLSLLTSAIIHHTMDWCS